MSESKELTLPERAAVALGTPKYEQEIRELVAKSVTITEVKNKDGREQCHGAMMTLKNARVAIEKAAKAAREDATAFSKAVIAEEKRLVALATPEETRLQALRDAWDEAEAAEKARKAAAEKAKVDAIRAKIDQIKDSIVFAMGKSSAEVQGAIDELTAHEITLEEFGALAGEAQVAKVAALAKLGEALTAQQAHEAEAARLAAEREQLERARAEAAERERQAAAERARIDGIKERIAQIKATVAMQAGKPSASIESAISALQAMGMDGLGEFFDEAEEARHAATVALGEMAATMRAHEAQQEELKRQQAELAKKQAEQEERERIAREAEEAEAERKRKEDEARAAAEKLETDHAEALVENARIDAERAAADEWAIAEITRIQRERDEFATNGPGDVEIVQLLAKHYDVTIGDVMGWMKKFDYAAADEYFAAANVAANRLEKAA
jgi:hypothetical protein